MRAGARVRMAVVVLSTVVLAGCWLAPGFSTSRRSFNDLEDTISVSNVASMQQVWSADIREGPAGPPIVTSGGLVEVATEGSVTAFDRVRGTQRWTWGTSAVPHPDDQLFVMEDGRVAVGLGSDQILWAITFLDEEGNQSGLNYSGGRVHSRRGTTLALVDTSGGGGSWLRLYDAATDAVAWSGVISAEPPQARVTLAGDDVVHAGPGLLTSAPGDTAAGNGVRAYALGEPATDCGTNGLWVCPRWWTAIDGEEATSPVVSTDGATLYVGTDAGTLYALDAGDGSVRWTSAVGASITDAPALAYDTLFVPTSSGALVALPAAGCGAAATCDPLWSTAEGSPLGVQPAVGGGVVFSGADDGTVQGFDAAGCAATTCSALWSAQTGSRITGAPAVATGMVFVGTEDGRVVAFR